MFDKLRSISRTAFALNADSCNASIVQVQKLVASLRMLRAQYASVQKVAELIEALSSCLQDKTRIIRELRAASIKIVQYGAQRTAVGSPKAVPLQMIEEAEYEEDYSPINTGSVGHRKGGRRHPPNEAAVGPKVSPKLGAPSSAPSPRPSPKTTQAGAQKPAMREEKKEAKRFSAKEREKFRRGRTGSAHVYSPSTNLPRRKPFDRTEGEEQMELIFCNTKRKDNNRRPSFELTECNAEHELIEDDRLNTSLALDYTTQNFMLKRLHIPRSKTRELVEKSAMGPVSPSKKHSQALTYTV